MLSIRYIRQFKKDYKRMEQRGRDIKKLRAVIEKLVNEVELEARYKDHPLQGNYAGSRDCHINADWVLIYAIVENELRLIRTGTHADLYK
jgi:addiction module toxin component, YafQ family/addiction module toxin, RelE/StbE family